METDATTSPPPSLRFADLLIRPRAAMERCRSATHVPFTALWSVLSAAGIVFYLILAIYPREGFGYGDALATLALLPPVLGLVGLKIAGWVLSKSGKFLGGDASPVHCHGALSVGLLPLALTLPIAVPLFVITPGVNIQSIAPVLALLQLVGTVGAAVSVVQAVSGVLQVSRLHAVVSLMGMFGFIYALVYLVQALT